jgi:hypothetical protein
MTPFANIKSSKRKLTSSIDNEETDMADLSLPVTKFPATELRPS